MPSIQIKNVPDDVHRILPRRAADGGESLQEYLLGRLIADVSRPTVDEVLARAGVRSGGRLPLRDAADQVRRERERR